MDTYRNSKFIMTLISPEEIHLRHTIGYLIAEKNANRNVLFAYSEHVYAKRKIIGDYCEYTPSVHTPVRRISPLEFMLQDKLI